MQPNFISIVLPCFNEKGNIIPLINEINEALKNQPHEIIVVDDNSPDGTYQAVVDLNLPYVKAILRTSDPSFAKSIRVGIEASHGNIVIIMDSDFNHEPRYLPIMVSNCQFYDVVSGSRFVYGGDMGSKIRHISSWVFNIFVRVLTRRLVTDSLFGFIAIRREALAQMDFDSIFWGYGDYCIRLMYYLQEKSLTILQIPVVLGQRKYGEGNKKLIKTLFKYLKATLHLVFISKKDSKICSTQ
jgi:dolichol-phosphate mannosyltransferase